MFLKYFYCSLFILLNVECSRFKRRELNCGSVWTYLKESCARAANEDFLSVMCELILKLTMETPQSKYWIRSGVFNFESS